MRPFLVFTLTLCWFVSAAFGQSTATPLRTETESTKTASAADSQPPPLKPAPNVTDAQMDVFLKTAAITQRKTSDLGTTAPMRATLSDNKLTHDAQIQCVDIFKPIWKGAEGSVEKNFRDTWKFNVAAYRVSRVIGLRNVPMSVEREIDGKQCSVTWWIDNVWMTEVDRRDKGIKPPATDDWVNQLNAVRVFDQLIYNTDRNQGNLLITPEWKLWMIDHTRAFRTAKTLMKVEPLRRIDQNLLTGLRNLKTGTLQQAAGAWLRPEEIAGIMARRDLIVRFFESEIQEKGEDSVITGIPRKTPSASVP